MNQPYTLRKSLGQHFLHNEDVCRRIVSAVPDNGCLLEVGPGGGALTKYFLQRKELNFKAIEFDREKVDFLSQQYPELKDKIIHQDILKADAPFSGAFNIVGNFPYNISGPILFKILDWEEQIGSVVGMFQKEVSKRVTAQEGNKQYGILSVLIQTFFKVEYLFDVAPENFTPPPKVNSGVIKLVRSENPYGIENKKQYQKFVKTAFGQRRKKLRNALSGLIDASTLPEVFAQKRAEELSVERFVELYKIYFS